MLTSAQVGSTMDGTSGASAEKYMPSPSSPQGTAKLVSSADMSSFMAMASPAMCAAGREAEAMNRVRLFQVSLSISPFSFLRYKKKGKNPRACRAGSLRCRICRGLGKAGLWAGVRVGSELGSDKLAQFVLGLNISIRNQTFPFCSPGTIA